MYCDTILVYSNYFHSITQFYKSTEHSIFNHVDVDEMNTVIFFFHVKSLFLFLNKIDSIIS